MELTYPINFLGFEEDELSGDVATRDGIILGKWQTKLDEHECISEFQFIADGETEPMFTESVKMPGSGMYTGMALRDICRTIREWYEGTQEV